MSTCDEKDDTYRKKNSLDFLEKQKFIWSTCHILRIYSILRSRFVLDTNNFRHSYNFTRYLLNLVQPLFV